MAIGADVADCGQVRSLFDQSLPAFGTLDIVVSNSGLQRDASFVDMTLDDWSQVIGTSLTGMFLCAQQAAREFLRRGPRPVSKSLGTIIGMSSVHETIAWNGHANYAAGKGGVKMRMRTIAQDSLPAASGSTPSDPVPSAHRSAVRLGASPMACRRCCG